MSNLSSDPALKRWLSLKAYGLFTSTLFRAHTPPLTLRARFEHFARVSREAIQQKHPRLVFEDHPLGSLNLESVRATDSPSLVVIHLHGGAFVFGSSSSYRNRAMRLSFRFDAEIFVPDYRLAPEHPFPSALEDGMQHDWPLTLPWLAESRMAWKAMRAFVDEHCAAQRRQSNSSCQKDFCL